MQYIIYPDLLFLENLICNLLFLIVAPVQILYNGKRIETTQSEGSAERSTQWKAISWKK